MLLLVLGIRKDCKFRTWKVFGVWQKRGARGRLEIPMDTEAKRKRRGKQVSSRGHALVRECGVCERPAGLGLCFSSRLARVVGTRGGLTEGEGLPRARQLRRRSGSDRRVPRSLTSSGQVHGSTY